MRYFLDTEFNGFGGELLSLGLVREDKESLYLVYSDNVKFVTDPWVKENVVPILWSIPSPMPGMAYTVTSQKDGANRIADFLRGDLSPYIITDWPDDISYFCRSIITGPGMMAPIRSVRFELARVDAYPTDLPGAVQHNSYWDAKALWYLVCK